jgi:hypothetical protein
LRIATRKIGVQPEGGGQRRGGGLISIKPPELQKHKVKFFVLFWF